MKIKENLISKFHMQQCIKIKDKIMMKKDELENLFFVIYKMKFILI